MTNIEVKQNKNIHLETLASRPLFTHGGKIYTGVRIVDGYHANSAAIWLDMNGARIDIDSFVTAPDIAENGEEIGERFRVQITALKMAIDDAIDDMRSMSGAVMPARVMVNSLAPQQFIFDTIKDSLAGNTSQVYIKLPEKDLANRFERLLAKEGTTASQWLTAQIRRWEGNQR